jgi:tetratricopeptide (TPR) repeat protein
MNLCVTALEAGALGEASEFALVALRIFEDLDQTLLILRPRLMIARISLSAGNFREAVRALREVVSGFESKGALDDAADARLDLAEALLMLGELDEVEAICTELVLFYRQQNIITNALTAASFLNETAKARSIKRRDIRLVRSYLKDLRQDPLLAFVPPPSSEPS